ncbi:hypothetical protein M5689_009188 [Euphorbia peplus]|nr:hypothetical protein M5689_009188 [Euphorbia peplus]
MANSRIAKFITEVAPPQYINVIRNRASKMLDTINEEDRDVTSPKSSATLTSTATTPSSVVVPSAVKSNYFRTGVPRSFSIFQK